jgi:hypothetical protein
MTLVTRRAVVTAIALVALGPGASFVAPLAELPSSTVSAQGDLPELRLVPDDAAFVGFADLRAMLTSPLWQQLRRSLPVSPERQGTLEAETGISFERDVDRVLIYAAPAATGSRPDAGLALARGRFNAAKIEELMRVHGASVEEYRAHRLLVSDRPAGPGIGDGSKEPIAVSFIEPGLAAIGTKGLVQQAIDRRAGGPNVTGNDEFMNLLRSLQAGDIWAVGRYEALGGEAQLPAAIAGQIPPISWMALSASISDGIGGVLHVEVRDEYSADGLRDIVRRFIDLGRTQAPPGPGVQTLLQSLELRGTGRTVTLSFDAPADLLDQLAARP